MAYDNNNNNGGLVFIGALWKPGKDENGQPRAKAVLNGKLGNARVIILKNKNKTSENSPDYHIAVANPNREGQERNNNNGEDDLPF
jgi:uncharacterized protein (DUF736 family)